MKDGRDVVRIVGAGPSGALLAILLQRQGLRVELYDARPDPRSVREASGRSINLALADRGIHALRAAGVFEQIASALMPMRGRCVHAADGTTSLQPYGRRPQEVIYSISRLRLSQALLRVAARSPGISMHFNHRLEDVSFAERHATVRDLASGNLLQLPMQPLLACDGAGSRVRHRMAELGHIEVREAGLDHGYKELSIPADADGRHRLDPQALHIWPRGDHMLIALPNDDGSFTATLFLPMHGAVSFAALGDSAGVEGFLRANFGDVVESMPDRLAEFATHPVGGLGTVYAAGWHAAGAVLIGDAAHAIVPFHGQGMNCCFEDCIDFAARIPRHTSWEVLFADFYAARKPNTDAIAAMALENYLEMRARVAEPRFQLQQSLALELYNRHPRRFIPRYAMVMFHHEICYLTAQRRGAVQSRLLEDLTRGANSLTEVDFARAARQIERELAPLTPEA